MKEIDEAEQRQLLPDDLYTPLSRQKRCGPTVLALMELLWRRRGRLIHSEQIGDVLWGHKSDPPSPNALAVHITHLRAALKTAGLPLQIKNVYGVGYMLIEPEAAPAAIAAACGL